MPALTARHFADRYGTCRKLFLDAAKGEGAALQTLQNPNANGPLDEPLYMDVARLGPPPGEASQVLILTSAVHGVEGFAGSGLQVFCLREELYRRLSEGAALVLVHAVNPYGFAHGRRVAEGNVDLNRNFLPHNGVYPDDSAYEAVHDLMAPADLAVNWQGYEDRIRAYIAERGQRVWQEMVTGGQWSHADGLFYGGRAPVWSNTTLRKVCAEQCRGASASVHIDLHTGLGPYGHGELIYCPDERLGAARIPSWYGTETTTALGDTASASAPLQGMIDTLWFDVPDAGAVTAVTLEYGTRDLRTVLGALALDNWLGIHGDPTDAQGLCIRGLLKDALYPDEDDWKEKICNRMVQVFAQTADGLSASG